MSQQEWISSSSGYGKPASGRNKLPYVLGTLGALVAFFVVGVMVVAAAAGVIGGGAPIEIVEARPAELVPTTKPPAATKVKAVPARTTKPTVTKTTTAKPKPTRTGPTYKELDARTWLTIVKDPDAHSGDRILIYGRIAQFDAATGADRFLALTGPTPYQDSSVVAAAFRGNPKLLKNFVKDDLFQANAVVLGTTAYRTLDGVTTKVPDLRIKSIKALS
ncbi:hypothetical protein JIG36_34820 [Actinoplanes sp. LDG1-06]|uniref:Uncharacterized protein n=1 Tax=Paractinoplanes ovalisporus TaxID=2810368 RepID=A0ABS2ALE4_9ACTN|nr:hypothetical protein [Actinoplanes ovalisporus]MBM2620687.1 hypothetical protein [Actinoplanes ovalisporus]